ncbi:hypothetical protein EV210_109190 [Anaerospora hongkongensis]|uniref:Uncharacterized protein n=1 Tax=Anaerospora hongkongensis TaxID=244830 RepID=A0A4R1PVL8_9FIRM|nr:hypothetical protein [Anaerospora hongkongensis]TCL36240.1 hypothetical protein EV210_109190 [Anaerospora hongkongensis]
MKRSINYEARFNEMIEQCQAIKEFDIEAIKRLLNSLEDFSEEALSLGLLIGNFIDFNEQLLEAGFFTFEEFQQNIGGLIDYRERFVLLTESVKGGE